MHTHVSFFVLWQQLVDGVGEQARVALGVLTDALDQLRVFFSHIVEIHKDGHLLPVGQGHLQAQGGSARSPFVTPPTTMDP